MMAPSDVIDWEEAMQQCGEDEEFLRELLADLRSEMETQLNAIASTIQNPQEAPYHQIMRAAHVVKGAAANLMCGRLRLAALNLEQAARTAHESGGIAAPQPLQQAVQAYYNELQNEAQQYVAFLRSIGV